MYLTKLASSPQTILNLLLLCSLWHCSALARTTISEGVINVTKISRQSLEGQFYNEKAKRGINFRSEGSPSSTSYISIVSTKGENIFSSTLLGDGVTLTSVMGGDYLMIGSKRGNSAAVYKVPRNKRQAIVAALLKFGVPMTVKHLSRAGYLDGRGADRDSAKDLRDLLASEEARQIHQTALELGKMGLYGIHSTGSMLFYVLAMRVANIHSASGGRSRRSSVQSALQQQRERHCRAEPETVVRLLQYKILAARQGLSFCHSNGEYCETCPRGEGCVGGCGVGCECWEMVCGDCCFHRGCFGHDACECGADQENISLSGCFNVFGFECDSAYTCPVAQKRPNLRY